MTIREYRESPLGVPDDYPDGATGFRFDAEALLERAGDWPAITRLAVEPGWLTYDEDGEPVVPPQYLGFALHAFDDRDGRVIVTRAIVPNRVGIIDRVHDVVKMMADALDHKRLDDAYAPVRASCEADATLAGPDVPAEMVAASIFRSGFWAAQRLYRGEAT